MRCFSVAAITLLIQIPFSLWGQTWTERAILEMFDQQSPLRREARASVAAAVEEMRGRTLWANPALQYSREGAGFTEFYQVEQSVPLSGRVAYYRRALSPVKEAAEAHADARFWDVRASLRQAVYRLLASQQQAETIEASLRDLEEIHRVLSERERQGEGSRYDRLRAERELRELKTDLIVAGSRAHQERTVLLSYLPRDAALQKVEGDLGPRKVVFAREESMQQALRRRAELRAETARLAQIDLERQAAERLRYPEPVFSVGLKRAAVAPHRLDHGVVVGLTLPLPLANKGRTEVARLSAEHERTQARRELLAQQVLATVGGAWDLYSIRLEALQVFEKETARIIDDLLRIARVGYQEGELGILELLDAYRVQRQTRLRRLELQAAVKEAEIELSRVTGAEVTP